MTLRAALIGCGRIGWRMAEDPLMAGDVFTHAEAYVRSAATDLVAVCDADEGEAGACAERWGAPGVYSDPLAMLDAEQPDIVSVATPDASHAAVVRAVIEHGAAPRAVLCEKPLALSLAEGEALVELARARGVMLAVMHMRRHAPNLVALAQHLASGALGKVTGVTGWYTKGTAHNGVHWFDQLRMLAGEVAWVEAHDTLGEGGEDPTLDVTLGLASGALATLRAADQRHFTLFEADLLTKRGRVRITDSGYAIDLCKAAPSPRYSGYVELAPEAHDFGSRRDVMLHAVNDLAAALAEGRPPACTGADGVAALRIADAALKAAREGRRIALTH